MPLFNNPTESVTDTPAEEIITPVEEIVEEPNLPEITMTVEDGSGVSDANVYCNLDYALEYCVNKGYTSWIELPENEQKIFLIRGTDFVDNFYEWKGNSMRGQFQSLAFPREHIFDDRGFEIKGIPDKLKKACIEAAFLTSISGVDSLYSTKDENGKIKKQKVDTLEVEYFGDTEQTSFNEVNYTSIYDILNKLLKGLYKTKADTGTVCTKAKWGV